MKGKQGFQPTHGLSKHPLYGTWKNIRRRCYNTKDINYKDYGMRGIVLCEEWRNDFRNFYKWAIENGWQKGLSIERIDYNGNYCPENCKWIPLCEQPKNRRGLVFITYKGETHLLSEWANILKMPQRTLSARLKSKNFTLEEAFEKPINKNLSRHTKEVN